MNKGRTEREGKSPSEEHRYVSDQPGEGAPVAPPPGCARSSRTTRGLKVRSAVSRSKVPGVTPAASARSRKPRTKSVNALSSAAGGVSSAGIPAGAGSTVSGSGVGSDCSVAGGICVSPGAAQTRASRRKRRNMRSPCHIGRGDGNPVLRDRLDATIE